MFEIRSWQNYFPEGVLLFYFFRHEGVHRKLLGVIKIFFQSNNKEEIIFNFESVFI